MLEAGESCLESGMTDDGLVGRRDDEAHLKQGFGLESEVRGTGEGCCNEEECNKDERRVKWIKGQDQRTRERGWAISTARSQRTLDRLVS
jgi:hypothetical protein